MIIIIIKTDKYSQMRKLNINNSKYDLCCICSPNDDQVISISDSLLKRIRLYLHENINRSPSQDRQNLRNQSLDFSRLLKMIFSRKFKNSKLTMSCRHTQLKKTFASKLNCSAKQIDRISCRVGWKIAKFHFHIDTVVSQSKSFFRHLLKPDQTKQDSLYSSNKKKSSQLILNEVKIQDEEGQNKKNYNNQLNKSNLISPEKNETINQNLQQIFNHPIALFWPISWQSTHFILPQNQLSQKPSKQNINDANTTKKI